MPLRVKEKMKLNETPSYQYVDDPARVEQMVRRLEQEKTIAVDLEADSMYHFTERVCLLQIATAQGCYLVDPLQQKSLSALKPVFADRNIQKIFHGADYDVRSLYRDFHIRIHNLFDTQIASRFLGYQETGLNAVLASRFNVTLDKKYQKKDWTLRPLPEEMLSYAARDVIFLIPLAAAFQEELAKLSRLDWVKDECELLSRVRPTANAQEPLFLRFKGAGRLLPRELAVLEAILKLRCRLAEEKDRPPFKIFGNLTIEKLVRLKPLDRSRLKKTKALSPKQIERYGDCLIDTIQAAMDLPASDLAAYPRKQKPVLKMSARNRVKALRCLRDEVAEKLKLDPSLVCSKAVINEIARQNPLDFRQLKKMPELKNWQKNLLGQEMVALLRKCHGRNA